MVVADDSDVAAAWSKVSISNNFPVLFFTLQLMATRFEWMIYNCGGFILIMVFNNF